MSGIQMQSVASAVTFISDDGRVSRRAFRRAEVELSREDWSVAVILAAMAVECELAYIYSKWKAIESDLLLNEITPTHAKLWEEEFRKLNTASQRLDAVSKMLTSVLSRNFRPQTITMRISILRF